MIDKHKFSLMKQLEDDVDDDVDDEVEESVNLQIQVMMTTAIFPICNFLLFPYFLHYFLFSNVGNNTSSRVFTNSKTQ